MIQKLFYRYSFILLLHLGFLSFACLADGATYFMPEPGNDIVGHVFTVKTQAKDTITTLRQRYEISYHELLEANPKVNFNKLKVGQNIVIPTEYILPSFRHGIVINSTELRLYYFSPDGRFVYTCPVGLGRADWRTPTTITKVVRKEYLPTWYVPESVREYMLEAHNKLLPELVPPGPDNPLGDYALYLAKNGYLIHGTNAPESVGLFASSGCMRLWSDSIEKLYQEVEVGTPVYIVHYALKAGWLGKNLYVEAHIPIKLDEELSNLNYKSIDDAITEATANKPAQINLQALTSVMKNRTGIPTPIGEQL